MQDALATGSCLCHERIQLTNQSAARFYSSPVNMTCLHAHPCCKHAHRSKPLAGPADWRLTLAAQLKIIWRLQCWDNAYKEVNENIAFLSPSNKLFFFIVIQNYEGDRCRFLILQPLHIPPEPLMMNSNDADVLYVKKLQQSSTAKYSPNIVYRIHVYGHNTLCLHHVSLLNETQLL